MSRDYTYKRYKLTDDEENRILNYWIETGCPIKMLAEHFKVSQSVADKIVNKYLKGKLYGKGNNQE